jgi:hypothetical protein
VDGQPGIFKETTIGRMGNGKVTVDPTSGRISLPHNFCTCVTSKEELVEKVWNHKKYCIPTGIGKLNIFETWASSLFLLFHVTGISHSNAWPGTASNQ